MFNLFLFFLFVLLIFPESYKATVYSVFIVNMMIVFY
jgi:hypothetical protein